VRDNFEFDKLVLAVALSIFTFVFSANLGGFLYRTKQIPDHKGIEIEIVDASDADSGPKGIPDDIDMGAIMASYDVAAGEAVFKKCAICHTVAKGDANKVGPNLWGVVGSLTAQNKGFAYSSAMAKRGEDGIKWTYEELYRYLYAPKKYVVGTKMAFAGLKKDADRINVIGYLRSLADKPLPLPAIKN